MPPLLRAFPPEAHGKSDTEIEQQAGRDAKTDPARYGMHRRLPDAQRHRPARNPAAANQCTDALQRQQQGKLQRRSDLVEQLQRGYIQAQAEGREEAKHGGQSEDRKHAQHQAEGKNQSQLLGRQFAHRGAPTLQVRFHGRISSRSARISRHAGRKWAPPKNWMAATAPPKIQGSRRPQICDKVRAFPSSPR